MIDPGAASRRAGGMIVSGTCLPAIGRNNRAPTIRITPSIRKANVGVSSRNVPKPNGADFFAPR